MRIQTTSGGEFDRIHIGCASDAHRMHIKSMSIHVNATDLDWMRIKMPM